MNTSLIVMARIPRPGTVKTRLAQSLGDDLAAQVFKACAACIFEEAARGSWENYISYSEGDPADLRRLAGQAFTLIPQDSGDLGRRLEHSFRFLFDAGANRVLAVAADVPDLSAGIIRSAVRSLDRYDVAAGPCPDGGYYLLGMNELHTGLFAGISWGTGRVLGQTLNAARKLRLNTCLLPTLADIDTFDDLLSWYASSLKTKGPVHDLVRGLGLFRPAEALMKVGR